MNPHVDLPAKAIDRFPAPREVQQGTFPDLSVRSVLQHPTRAALDGQGRLFVTDAKVGSVFVLDRDRRVVSEHKGLGRPLGIAVDSQGNIYVGSAEHRRVDVLDSKGRLFRVIGEGAIQMPNDLALDGDGNLYVADSLGHTVRVFDPSGNLTMNIGTRGDAPGELRFPAAIIVAARQDPKGSGAVELYVADQGNGRVQVFDLAGRFLRTFGEPVEAFVGEWRGSFVRPQSLAMDSQGRLHVLDVGLTKVQIMDPVSGDFVADYGTLGRSVGQLYLPLHIVMLPEGQVALTDSGNRRLEILRIPDTQAALGR
ncbi:MAG: hypothetical protein ABI333_01615 [bacterium]